MADSTPLNHDDIELRPIAARAKYFWVFVFPNPSFGSLDESEQAGLIKSRDRILRSLKELDLTLFFQKSRDGDELFVKVGASQELLENYADDLRIPIKLKAKEGEGGVHYAEFEKEKKDLYQGRDESETFKFRSKEAMNIVLTLIEEKKEFGGCGIDYGKEIEEGNLISFFPVHGPGVKTLMDKWAMPWKNSSFYSDPRNYWDQPLDEIRDYFGEKIALYFCFLGFYTKWLVFPMLLGIALFGAQMSFGRYDVKNAIPVYSVFMGIWATCFLEAWKREQVTRAYEWNMMDFEEEEKPRPSYPGVGGEKRMNPVTGEEELWYDPDKRKAKYIGSFSFLFVCILVVIGAIVSILILRKYLEDGSYGWTAGIINGVVIAVFNMLYKEAAVMLTSWENHRTDTDYEDALIAKSFLFQFCNSYLTLYIVAFIKPSSIALGVEDLIGECLCTDLQYYTLGVEDDNGGDCETNADVDRNFEDDEIIDPTFTGCACEQRSCVEEIATLLVSIFVVQLAVGNFIEFGVPYIKGRIAMYMEERSLAKAGQSTQMSKAEYEAKLAPYESPFDDYNELVIQFGYISFFAVAFPLCAALAFCNNLVEIRSDATKLCRAHRRPEARGAEDIGTWYTILEIMSFSAVTTNCGIVFFTSDFGDALTEDQRVWGFFVSEHCLVGLKLLLGYLIPDIPEEIQIEIDKEKYEGKMALRGEENAKPHKAVHRSVPESEVQGVEFPDRDPEDIYVN